MRIVCNLKEKREITNNLEIQIIRHACTQGQLHAEPSWLEMTWDFSEAIDFFFYSQGGHWEPTEHAERTACTSKAVKPPAHVGEESVRERTLSRGERAGYPGNRY